MSKSFRSLSFSVLSSLNADFETVWCLISCKSRLNSSIVECNAAVAAVDAVI